MVIGVLVEAGDQKTALSRGKDVLDIISSRYEFDYYTPFDADSTSMSGRGRYGEWMRDEYGAVIEAIEATDPNGESFIDSRWQATETAFERNVKTAQFLIENCSPEQLQEGEIPSELEQEAIKQGLKPIIWPEFVFDDLAGGGGSQMFLYDSDGWGIITDERLESYRTDGYWIVPADVHY